MGLSASRCTCLIFLFSLLTFNLDAAPKLRLSTATVGPVDVAVGANGAAQQLDAINAGDGSLNLSASSSVAWLAPAIGAARACTLGPSCLPVNIALQTSALAKGIHTGTVTVSDPNAVDAPQTVTVTVQVGGGIPDKVELFVPPNGSTDDVRFSTGSRLTASVSTQSGGSWLSLALDGGGSFRFSYPWKITGRRLGAMAAGDYNGSIAVSGSTLAANNKTVPVVLKITSQPILRATPEVLRLRIAEKALKQKSYIALANRGAGALSITGATASTASGGSWLSAARLTGTDLIEVTADTASVAPGVYHGSIAVAANAVNSVTVPVELTVLAEGPPVAFVEGVVNNATFNGGEAVAQGGIVSLFGEQLSAEEPRVNSTNPVARELGGAKVLVNGQPVPMYYSSYGQINFQIPYETPAGEALVRVERSGRAGNAVAVKVAPLAPRILRLGIGEYGIAVNQDGTFPIPATPGLPSRPARPGDVLVIYAIGLGPTTPGAQTGVGAPADPLARATPTPQVVFGGKLFQKRVAVDPLFAGLTPTFVGLYQVNVQVPEDGARGNNVGLTLHMGGVESNLVEIAVQ